MKDRYVVDTNVLIAASAVDLTSAMAIHASPAEPELRKRVKSWLDAFSASPSKLILDGSLAIEQEYRKNLSYSDYGIQVLQHKWDTLCVELVDIAYDQNGYAILGGVLEEVVHDNADRKMVAAAVAVISDGKECCIVFAGESDWHAWEDALSQEGICLEPLIEEWSRAKYQEKLGE